MNTQTRARDFMKRADFKFPGIYLNSKNKQILVVQNVFLKNKYALKDFRDIDDYGFGRSNGDYYFAVKFKGEKQYVVDMSAGNFNPEGVINVQSKINNILIDYQTKNGWFGNEDKHTY